jgi:hypothetical protein
MNALLDYIYHGPPNSGADYHYTATDIVMAALIIVPGVVVWVSFLFAGRSRTRLRSGGASERNTCISGSRGP